MKRMALLLPAVFGWATFCPGEESLSLPPPDLAHNATLMQALSARRSSRTFDPRELPPGLMSDLLWAAAGANRPDGRRTAPTARNWQEIDVYVALPSGLYRYDPAAHRLDRLSGEDLRGRVQRRPFPTQAPLVLIYVADLDRMTGANDWAQSFYSATDVGFISQNVYLLSAARGLHTVVLGAVDREAVAEHMGLGPSQRILLAQPVGFPPGAEPVPEASRRWSDGLYRGVGEGYEGDIEVEVRVGQGRLLSVEVTRDMESLPGRAFELLPDRIVEAQGVDSLEAVTGATMTSSGVLEAARNALQEAESRATP